MPVMWRTPGGKMGTVDLRRFDDNQVVIHYGGVLGSVDAYTFANSLVSFADTIRAINSAINPGQNIEVRIEAMAPGSFRAVVKRVRKGIPGFLGRQIEGAIGALIALVFIGPLINSEGTVTEVFDDRVEIRNGGDLIIIPREAYEQLPNIRNNVDVQKGVQRTIEIIERDDAIDNFGVTPDPADEQPEVQIDRDDFARLTSPPQVASDNPTRRSRKESVRLVILKAWLKPGNRKWSFEWNGVPISAPVKDLDFQRRLERHEQLIGNGDALDVILEYFQDFDPKIGVWVNDQHSFEVIEVVGYVSRSGEQGSLVDG